MKAENELKRYGMQLLRGTAERVSAGITTGHDWPNNQHELDCLQAARLLREAANEIEDLRNWARLAFQVLHHVGPALEGQESETPVEADMVERLRKMAYEVAVQYPTIAGIAYTTAWREAREDLEA